jgi:hypothetical protein
MYEHFIYSNPTSPYWNAMDIPNYNLHAVFGFKEKHKVGILERKFCFQQKYLY